MTGLKDPTLIEPFMEEAKKSMSVGNSMGIGYSAVTKDGNFFTERWHDNDSFFNRDSVRSKDIVEELSQYKKYLSKFTNMDQNYSITGTMNFPDVTTVTMHTRFATCGKEFENTHPFVDSDTSLVHNGMINNYLSLNINKVSTCDSEAGLQAYINNNVGKEIGNAQAWLNTLSGYWAFGILSRDANGTRILDIIRNDAWLYYSQVTDFGTVLATTEEIITSATRKLGLEYTKPAAIKSNKLFRFNAVTGELMSQTQLEDSNKNSRYNYSGYQGNSNYGQTDDYYSIMGAHNNTKKKELALVESTLPKESKKEEQDDQSINTPERTFDDMGEFFEYLYDTNEPLIDRLYDYDEQFSTNHAYQYECLPKYYIQENWQLDDFDAVLDEIVDSYNYCFGEDTGVQ